VPDELNLRLLDALGNMADTLVEELQADACAISRAIGEVLILVCERVPPGMTLQQGQGYLVPDYPQTEEVLDTGRPRALTLDDDDLDEAEASVLRQHGLGALLMLRLDLNGDVWGLVEVYRLARSPFSAAQIRRATELVKLG
jgi:transcriptional regulator with GAF, ATPase, and Fis domain